MIKSMTAFATNDAEFGNIAISCELRSVNHRYLEITFKLPDRMRFAESEIRKLISTKISRGKVECAIILKKQKGLTDFVVDQSAVDALIAVASAIEKKITTPRSYSALDILSFPGIQQESELDKTALTEAIIKLIGNTIEQLSETRNREGNQLKALIQERCTKIQNFIAQANNRVPDALAALRTKLTDRISELVQQPDFDRLEQELVFLAQKLDVTEELDRLSTHITEVLRVMSKPEPVGRRLDFLMQELNREANTLGSKSIDKELTQISIELKVLIEQIREQIQNIE